MFRTIMKKRVLLVDNDPDILELLRMGLEEMGFSVRTTFSGLAALRAIEEDLPDILVTDLVMPNISGEKLLKIVRAVPEWGTLRTIVISGVAAEAPELRSAIPCDIYIAKGPIARTLGHLKDSIELLHSGSTPDTQAALGVQDIRSRHVTRELYEFKAEVDSILDQITDGICRVDRNGIVVWMNHAFSRLIQQPEEKALGRDLAPLLDERDRGLFRELLHEGTTGPTELRTAAAVQYTVLRATRLEPAGDADTHITLLWQDVTERMLSEEQYENIVESTGDLVLTTDLTGRINYANSASTRLARQEPDRLVGTHVWDLAPGETRTHIRNRFLATVEQFTAPDGDTRDLWEMPLPGTGTNPRVGEVSCSPFRSKAGRIMGVHLIITDITDRRNLENERSALLYEVQHRVRDNLQLVASLARLSAPEHLDTRIAAVSEVFDELYREQSFSRIKAQPLLERIVTLGLAETCCCRDTLATFRISEEFVPMRTAVPLSLIIVEMLSEMSEEYGRCTELAVDFHGTGTELTLSLRYSGSTGSQECDECRSPDATRQEIISVLAEQLSGTCVVDRSESSLRYTITIIADPSVP